jgi:hypothetical protein
MLHARTPALTIEELQAIVTAQQGYARRTGASFTSAGR